MPSATYSNLPNPLAASDWTSVYKETVPHIISREIRVSPTGIVVIEDILPDGQVRHTRTYPNGMTGQATESTPRKAWEAARKVSR